MKVFHKFKPTLFPLLISLICLVSCQSASKAGEIPVDGTYTYDIIFAEWNKKGPTCQVIIKDGKITVIDNGDLYDKKGTVIEEGVIRKHIESGKFIISTSEEDIHASEVGGCTDGPTVIYLKKKRIELC